MRQTRNEERTILPVYRFRRGLSVLQVDGYHFSVRITLLVSCGHIAMNLLGKMRGGRPSPIEIHSHIVVCSLFTYLSNTVRYSYGFVSKLAHVLKLVFVVFAFKQPSNGWFVPT